MSDKTANDLARTFLRDLDIVQAWLSIPENVEKIPVVAYSKEVYTFITHTLDCIPASYDGGLVGIYKVANVWVRPIMKVS